MNGADCRGGLDGGQAPRQGRGRVAADGARQDGCGWRSRSVAAGRARRGCRPSGAARGARPARVPG